MEQLSIGRGLLVSLPGWSDAVSTPIVKALPMVFTKFMIGRISFSNKIFYVSYFLSLFVLYIWLIIQGLQKHKNEIGKISILCFVPIGLTFLVTIFIPILAPQRVIYCLPLFLMLLAVGINSVKNSKLKYVVSFIFITVSLYGILQYGINPSFQREDWKNAVIYVENTSAGSNSLIIFAFSDAFAPWQWYSRQKVDVLAIAPAFVVNETILNNYYSVFSTKEKIYYFKYLTDLTDPQKKVENFLSKIGFIEKSVKDFPGVGFIIIYEKALAYN
jgi:hypothetical protein